MGAHDLYAYAAYVVYKRRPIDLNLGYFQYTAFSFVRKLDGAVKYYILPWFICVKVYRKF